MIDAQHIPPEVVEAAELVFLRSKYGDDNRPAAEVARAAIAAALAAWPGAETGLFAKGERNMLATILPLQQEARSDG